MTKLIRLVASVAFAAISGSLFAYNGGYENSLDYKEYPGVGYANNELTAREESGTTIAANAYAQCKKLTSVNLANVTSVGDAAFAYSALTSVELPSTLKSMGYIAFGGCSNLTSVTINSTSFMTSADEAKEPFRDCTKLTTVTAKCEPPTWDFKKIFPAVTTVKVPQANIAVWQAKKYSGVTVESTIPSTQYGIEYDLAGGTAGADAPDLADRNKWPEISAPTRAGYVFAGWKATSGLGSGAYYSVVSGKAVSLTSASTAFGAGYASCTVKNLAVGGGTVTLTATWAERTIPSTKYAIEYDLAGGTAGADAPDLADRNKWPEISAPTRAGYVFAGWKATSGLASAGAYYSVVSGKAVSLLSASTAFGAGYASCTVKNLAVGGGTVTLTATWKERTIPSTQYGVEYDLAGGTAGAEAPDLADRNKWPEISAPTRTGYVFAGWKATSGLASSGAYYSVVSGKAVSLTSASTVFGAGYASCTVKNLAAGGKVVKLTATWSAIPSTQYGIEYDLAGGTAGAEAPALVDRNKWPKISAPTRSGYVFAGWKATSGLASSGAYYSVVSGKAVSLTSASTAFGSEYASCTVKNLAAGGKTVTLTATWKENSIPSTQYGIEYVLAGGTAGAEAPAVVDRNKWPTVSAPTRSGYAFAGWKATSGLASSGAYYSVVSGKAVSLPSASTAFGAEYASCTVKNLAAGGKTVTLTATWKAIPSTKYVIDYDFAGGTAGSKAPTLVDRNKWPEISAPTRTGYVFAGWKATSGLASSGAYYSVVSGKAVSLTSASTVFGAGYASCTVKNLAAGGSTVKLTATWTGGSIPSTQYGIEYDLAGGTAGAEAPALADRNKWPKISAPTRAGYVFAGWKATSGLASSGAYYSVVSGKAVSLSSASTAFGAGYASCTVKNLASGGGTVTLTATWKAVQAASYAVSGSQTGVRENVAAAFEPGYVCGVFADGTGTFDLLLDEDGSAFFAAWTENGDWASECEADLVGDTLILHFENGDRLVLRRENGLAVAE